MNGTKYYYNEGLEDNAMYKFILSPNISRLFDDFLITTGIKKYDHTSAIHTSLLYEYFLGRAIAKGYTIEDYQKIMRSITMYAIEKSREGACDE